MATSIEKKSPHPTRTWNNPIERFFRSGFPDFWKNDLTETVPSLNIREEKNSYKIDMAAPGLNKEDISIDVDRNVLTISYEHETDTRDENEKDSYSHREYNYSHWSRSLSLPDNADGNHIKARYINGVLELTIAKRTDGEKEKKQRVKIE